MVSGYVEQGVLLVMAGAVAHLIVSSVLVMAGARVYCVAVFSPVDGSYWDQDIW